MRPAVRGAARAAAVAALLLAPVGPARATTPAGLFEQGNDAYEQNRFQEAAEAYERLLGYGVRDPRVHYNLANAYYKMGRLGGAILHYERTLRLDPADLEARDNLVLARGLIHDRVAPPELPYPVAVVTGFLDRLPVDRVTGIFLLLYVLTAALAGAIPLARGPAARRVLAYGAVTAGLAAAAAGGGLVYAVRQAGAPRAVVMEERADVLSGPAEDNTVLFTVHEGTSLEVRNIRDGWYQVSLPNALSGWIRSDDVETV